METTSVVWPADKIARFTRMAARIMKARRRQSEREQLPPIEDSDSDSGSECDDDGEYDSDGDLTVGELYDQWKASHDDSDVRSF